MEELKITDAAIAASGVQSQPDKLTGTAAQNKAVFDRLITAVVKEKFNALIDALTGTGGAGSIGINTITGLSASEVQSALEQIMTAMQDITQGAVADASITLAKLAAEVTAVALGGAAASHTHSASDIASGTLDAARIPIVSSDKIASGAIIEEKLGAAAVTANKIGAAAVQSAHLAANCVTNLKLADGAVNRAKIADGSVTAEKLAAGGVTAEKLAPDLTYAAVHLTAEQVRTITAGTADPSGGSDGDIYIQYTE